jgi:hypothetical protein
MTISDKKIGGASGFCSKHKLSGLRYGCPECSKEHFLQLNAVIEQKYKEQDMAKPSNHNKRWTQEEEAAAIIEFAKGTQITNIAGFLGRTEVSVLGKLATFDLVEFRKDENAYYTVATCLYAFE